MYCLSSYPFSFVMDFRKLFKTFCLSNHFIVIFALLFTQELFISFTQVLMKTEAYSDSDEQRVALIALAISILFGASIKVYIFFTYGNLTKMHKETSLIHFNNSRIADWMITELRIQFRVFLRLFLLIIPGVIEAVRLSFALPYMFWDKRMKDPYFDPIEESLKQLPLDSKLLIPLFFYTWIVPISISLLTYSKRILFESPLNLGLGLVSTLAQTLVLILSYAYVIHIFIMIKENTTKEGDS